MSNSQHQKKQAYQRELNGLKYQLKSIQKRMIEVQSKIDKLSKAEAATTQGRLI